MKERFSFMYIMTFLIGLSFGLQNNVYAKSKKKYETKHLSLSIGGSHDEDIPLAHRGFKSGGDYKKFVKLQYNKKENTLRIIPKSQGFGTLTLQNPNTGRILYEFKLDVKKSKLNKMAREIKSLLQDIEGINIKILNNRVVVDGKVLLPKDIGRIHNVVKQYGDSAANLVSLSSKAQVKIAQYIERAINNPEIQVRALNGKFLLEGVANSDTERKKAEILARAYMPSEVAEDYTSDDKIKKRPSIVINLIQVRPAPVAGPGKVVQLVIHYVELQKDYSKGFRIQWMPDLGDGSSMQFTTGGKSASGLVSTITGTIRNLLPKLNWAKQHGHARVLNSASLIVQDGKQGVLKSTTGIPYTGSSKDGTPITNFKDTGLVATIKPIILGERSDSVQVDTDFNVKSLIGSTTSGPIISNKSIKTNIVVRSGQSAAIGGLISNSSGTNYNRLPANVSKNPILSLYASKDFRRSQSQFVVFITPLIKSSASQGADKIKRRFRIK